MLLPDWADMCKHVAATLYGIGARLDSDPDLLFTLRGVDRAELVSVGVDLPLTRTAAASERVLADDDVAALFGIDIAATEASAPRQSGKEKMQARGPAAAPAPAHPKKSGPSGDRSRSRSGEGARGSASVKTLVEGTVGIGCVRRRPRLRNSMSVAKSKATAGAARPTRVVKPPAADRQP